MFQMVLKVIPSSEMRECAKIEADDYWWDDAGVFQVRIAEQLTLWNVFPVMMHTLTEAMLYVLRGKDIRLIDEYDAKCPPDLDPGNQLDCPYYQEHQEGNLVERLCVLLAGKKWHEYDRQIDLGVGRMPRREYANEGKG
jgi:hypothetical protein